MAKSKLIQANKKIEEAVVGGYRKIEQTVVGGYQSIENTVVGIALGLGVGMCLSMVFGKMVLGIAVGIIGIVVLLMLIPLTKGLK